MLLKQFKKVLVYVNSHLSSIDLIIRIFVIYLYFFCIISYLKCYIDFDIFVYLSIQFWYIRVSMLCSYYFLYFYLFSDVVSVWYNRIISSIIRFNLIFHIIIISMEISILSLIFQHPFILNYEKKKIETGTWTEQHYKS